MTITLVQKNGSASTDTLDATPPAWGSPPVSGNLLVIVCAESQNTNSTWPTTPTGYTAAASTPFQFYPSGTDGAHGMFWKIATGGDATPGHYGEVTGTQDWVTYTYEFASTTGWIASAADREVHSAASSTAGTSKASGSTAALSQANELAIAFGAAAIPVSALAFTNGFTLATPGVSDGKLWVGWQSTSSTAALSTTASWTTSTQLGVKIVTFKAASGTTYTQSLTGAVSFVGAAPAKGVARRLPGAVSFSGTVAPQPYARLLAGAFTPAGALSAQQSLFRTLTGGLGFAGAVNASTGRLFSGALGSSGTLASLKSVAKGITGALSFSGSQTHIAGKVLTGSMTPTGSLGRTLSLHQVLDAAVFQPAGVLGRLTSRTLSAVLRPVGMVASSSRAPFAAVLRPVGVVAHGLPQRTLSAAVSFAGSIPQRAITRAFVSSLIASGVLHTRYMPPVRPPLPGGGGFGVPMPDSFFTRYKPTLRRQR